MLDTFRIHSRIKEIRKRVVVLVKNFKTIPEEKFLADDDMNAAAERNLEVAIQACIDIGNHIVAALGLRRESKELAEVFRVLTDEKVIKEDLAKKMVSATGYRNVIVHQYLEVDRKETYNNIQNRLLDLSEFAKQIELFLERYEKKSK